MEAGPAAADIGEDTQDSPPTVVGAVDVGSNSVHLLVASVADHELEALADQSVFLGLGAAADAGRFGAEARAGLIGSLVAYGDLALQLGARRVTFIGTEPMRRAADAAVVVAEVERACGIPLHVVGHEEEALLTLVGVTGGRPVDDDLAVVDTGGGSTELAFVGPGRRAVAAGIRVGSARLTSRFVASDPPTAREVQALRAAARQRLADAPEAAVRDLVAVGGTASNLIKVLPELAADRRLSPSRLEAAMEVLMAAPADDTAARFVISPIRARILPAGAAILEALLERYGLSELRVAEEGVREGTVLVTAHAGASWRDRLEPLAHGWVR